MSTRKSTGFENLVEFGVTPNNRLKVTLRQFSVDPEPRVVIADDTVPVFRAIAQHFNDLADRHEALF